MSINNTINQYLKQNKIKNKPPIFISDGIYKPNNGIIKGNPNPNAYTYNNSTPTFSSPVMSDGFGNYVIPNTKDYTPFAPSNPVAPSNPEDGTSDGTSNKQPSYSPGYQNLVNAFQQNGSYNVSLPNYGVFNPYLGSNLSNLGYYQNLQKQIENNLDSLLTAKYGAGNYTPNNGWYQGDAIEGWDKYSENQGFAQYQKLMADLQNVNNMIGKYQSIEQSRQQDTANLGIQQELIEKYLQEDRRIRGVETSGQAETSNNAILNAYINASNQIRQNAQDNLHGQEMAFQNAQYQNMSDFNNKIQGIAEEQEKDSVNDLKELITMAQTSEDFELLEEVLGEEIAKNPQLQYLFESGKTNASKLESSEEEETKQEGQATTSDIQEMMMNATSLDDLVDIEQQFGEQIQNDAVLSYWFNNFKKVYEQAGEEASKLDADSKYLNGFGVTDMNSGITYQNMNQSMFDWTNVTNPEKNQYKIIDAVKEMASKGYIPNGTVMDLNKGIGSAHYVYYNGSFYPVSSDLLTKGWDGIKILDRYSEYQSK